MNDKLFICFEMDFICSIKFINTKFLGESPIDLLNSLNLWMQYCKTSDVPTFFVFISLKIRTKAF